MRTRIYIYLSVVVCLVMIAFPMAKASAPETAELQYKAITLISAGINISDGKATYTGTVVGGNKNAKTYMTVKLQRQSSTGGDWVTIASGSDFAEGTGSAFVSKTKSVSKGYNYRTSVIVRIYDEDGNLIETATKNSAEQDY